jgi:hypothetical protein
MKPLSALDSAPRFALCCLLRADLVDAGIITRQEGVDKMQAVAEYMHLPDLIGPDAVQAIMAQAFATFDCPPQVTAPPLAPACRPEPRRSYTTPKSTVEAFFYLVSLNDPEYLARWLDQHPRDEKFLCKLWQVKHAAAA